MHTRLVYISRTPDFSVRVPLVQSSIKIPLLKFSFINTTCIKVLASYLHTHTYTQCTKRACAGSGGGVRGGALLLHKNEPSFFLTAHTHTGQVQLFFISSPSAGRVDALPASGDTSLHAASDTNRCV